MSRKGNEEEMITTEEQQEKKQPMTIIEREINLALINEKLNLILNLLQKESQT
jgi:hypothetical protein